MERETPSHGARPPLPASIVRSRVTVLWIVLEESSSSIMPLTAASICSNRRCRYGNRSEARNELLVMIEPYPDSVLPRIWRRPASQSSANCSNVTEDGRRKFPYRGSEDFVQPRLGLGALLEFTFPLLDACWIAVDDRPRLAPPVGLTIWPPWLIAWSL